MPKSAPSNEIRDAGRDPGRWLAALVDGSGDAIFGVCTEGTVISWNPAAESLFGYAPAEIIGRPAAILTPPERRRELDELRSRLLGGGPPERLETVRLRRDGTLVEVLLTASPVFDAAGVLEGLSVVAHDITERRAAQRALETSRRQLADAQRVAEVGSAEFDVQTGAMTRSDELYRILGVPSPSESTAPLHPEVVHPDDRAAVRAAWAGAVHRGAGFELGFRIVRPDGSLRHLRGRGLPERAPTGEVRRVTATYVDETSRHENEQQRHDAEGRFEISFEKAAIGAAIVGRDGVPSRVNPALCNILQRPEADLVGRTWDAYTHPSEVPPSEVRPFGWSSGQGRFERRYVRPDGTSVLTQIHVTLVEPDVGEPYYFAQIQDITAQRVMELELKQRAFHDPLTGLPNRTLVTEQLAGLLQQLATRPIELGVVLIGIDHFKLINDSFGRSVGDELLERAADRVRATIGSADIAARFDGDEFVVVCEVGSAGEAERLAGRILRLLDERYMIDDHQVNITASAGVAMAGPGCTPESLLRDADIAMRHAKDHDLDVALFDERLRSTAVADSITAAELHRALGNNELAVHYQPVVDASTGQVVSAEALVRWDHPERGTISPGEFIPFTERSGLIVPIGAWVLEQACRQLAAWQRVAPAMTVAVNISARQLLAGATTGTVEDILRRTGVRPQSVCLELTESVLMADVEYFEDALRRLKGMGLRLAIDDFGTGYSSLSYLKQFPVDAVKVDRAFVDGLGTDQHDTALVAAIIAMADALGLEVTAEGVETQGQLADLRALGCDRVQGFYLAPALPAEHITTLLADPRPFGSRLTPDVRPA